MFFYMCILNLFLVDNYQRHKKLNFMAGGINLKWMKKDQGRVYTKIGPLVDRKYMYTNFLIGLIYIYNYQEIMKIYVEFLHSDSQLYNH